MGWQQSQDSRQRTRVNTDNGDLFLAQSTDSQRKVNLANADTLL